MLLKINFKNINQFIALKKRRFTIYYLISIFCNLFLISCNKEELIPPECEIIFENQENIYHYSDTIYISARITKSQSVIVKVILTINDKEKHFFSFDGNNTFRYKIYGNDIHVGTNLIKFVVIDINHLEGIDEQQFELFSEKPVITTEMPKLNDDNSVRISGKLQSTGGIKTMWGICYSKQPNPTKDNNIMITQDTVFSVDILPGDAEFNTLYYVRSWAENADGIAYGDEYKFVLHDYRKMIDPRDNKVYRTITIGDQVWMAENLAWEGDSIFVIRISDPDIWSSSTNGYTYYFNDKTKYEQYGILYQFDAARYACPSGWRLPTPEDWDKLCQNIGGSENAGNLLKSLYGWRNEGNGIDKYGFNILPAGFRHNDGSWGWDEATFQKWGMFWANEDSAIFATFYYCAYNHNALLSYDEILKSRGKNVRCIKND